MDNILAIILFICLLIANVLGQIGTGRTELDKTNKLSASYNIYKSAIDPYCVSKTIGQQPKTFPTGQSIENLIALIERLELNLENNTDPNLNKLVGADNVAKLFLRRFRFDGYDPDIGSMPYQSLRDRTLVEYSNAFFPQEGGSGGADDHTYYFPDFIYTQTELCSLYQMLSHNVFNPSSQQRTAYSSPFLAFRHKRQAYPSRDNRQQFPQQNYGKPNTNQNQLPQHQQFPNRPIQRSDTQTDVLVNYPIKEEGVVSFRSNQDEAIAPGRVLIGVVAGLATNLRVSANEILKSLRPNLQLNQDRNLDPVMALTIADLWGIATGKNTDEKKYYYGLKGQWSSGSCTTTYALTDVEVSQITNAMKNIKATKAEIRGGLDGYQIGKSLQSIGQINGQKKPRLSAILRSYYSKPKTQKQGSFTVTYCNRDQQINLQLLQETATGYAAINTKINGGNDPEALLSEFNPAFTAAQQKETSNGLNDYCSQMPSGSLDKSAPCETPSDVIYVVDGQNLQKLHDSAKIVSQINGNLINIRSEGGKVSIFMNSQGANNVNPDVMRWMPTGPGGWPLVPAAFNTTNIGSAQCRIDDFNISFPTPLPNTGKYMQYLNQTLMNYEYWANTNASAVPSKTAVLIDFDTVPMATQGKDKDDFNYWKDQLRYRHRDVNFIAISNKKEVFQDILRDDKDYDLPTNIQNSASSLAQRICDNPATFQYNSCYDRRSDNVQYIGYVSPGYKQNWAMYPEFFLKSFNIKFTFKPEDGEIKVCYDRWFPPERNDPNYCKEVKSGEEAVFEINNPCKGKSVTSCDPFYFTVWGKDRNTGTQCLEDGCLSMDQIKFTASHSGVQCNSSLNVSPSTTFQLICLSIFAILYLFFNK